MHYDLTTHPSATLVRLSIELDAIIADPALDAVDALDERLVVSALVFLDRAIDELLAAIHTAKTAPQMRLQPDD
jgi:hypothetical protein